MIRRDFVKTIGAFALAAAAPLRAAPKTRPNVVIIYGDDVGYGDVGCYGAKMIPTPHIDKFAAESLMFTDGHCTAATCTPSRYSLLTGKQAFRGNARVLSPNAPLIIPTDILTLPKVFKQAGYKTGVVGKWHLGLGAKGVENDWNAEIKPGPLEIGFDYSFLLPYTNDRVPCVYLEGHKVVGLDPDDPISIGRERKYPNSTEYPDGKKNRAAMTYYESSHGHNESVINGIGRIGYMYGGKSALWDDEGMADVFVDKMKQFVDENKDEPFFLYFSSQDIHVPRTPHPRFQGKSELGYRGDAMVQFDWSTGQILKTLEEHGLRENTIVIFSSDNGPVYDDGYKDGTTVRTSSKPSDRGHFGAGPFRGGKYQIYEGGTRVPFIVGWPGRIEPGVSEALVSQVDLLASFAAMLGIPLAEGQASDSIDTLDALLGKDRRGAESIIEEAGPLALRYGKWKYIRGKKAAELYDLEQDIAEKNNIASERPELVKRLDAMLQEIIDKGRRLV
jgi:arylsulfatase A